MKRIFYLASCSTCQKILKTVKPGKDVALQNIKEEIITPAQLDAMKKLAGSYEALFSKRSMKYRAWSLHEKELTEKEMRDLILKEYTFLKRPVAIIEDQIFIGSTKETAEGLKKTLKE